MNEQRIHRFFQINVLLKGAHAAIEIAGGLALYLVSTDAIAGLVRNGGQSRSARADLPPPAAAAISAAPSNSAAASPNDTCMPCTKSPAMSAPKPATPVAPAT